MVQPCHIKLGTASLTICVAFTTVGVATYQRRCRSIATFRVPLIAQVRNRALNSELRSSYRTDRVDRTEEHVILLIQEKSVSSSSESSHERS